MFHKTMPRVLYLGALVLDSKTLFPAGRICPVETAAKFPSQVPPSDTVVPSTTDTLPSTAKSMLNDSLVL